MLTLFYAGLLLLLPLPSANEAANLATRMEMRYRNATTLQATFLERYAENGAVLRAEAGTAYFRRPGKMRWEYDRPEKDLFLVDGKTAWFYVPADHTVTRVPAKQSEDLRTPLALLAGILVSYHLYLYDLTLLLLPMSLVFNENIDSSPHRREKGSFYASVFLGLSSLWGAFIVFDDHYMVAIPVAILFACFGSPNTRTPPSALRSPSPP